MQESNWINLDRDAFIDAIAVDANAVIIDVRSAQEFQSGCVEGAINIPFTKRSVFLQLRRDKAYYLYCHSGGRSGLVANFLHKEGFPKIINLNDGIQFWPGDELYSIAWVRNYSQPYPSFHIPQTIHFYLYTIH